MGIMLSSEAVARVANLNWTICEFPFAFLLEFTTTPPPPPAPPAPLTMGMVTPSILTTELIISFFLQCWAHVIGS
jgi:hypothetical protein